MNKLTIFTLSIASALFTVNAYAEDVSKKNDDAMAALISKAPEDAKAYFIDPVDGAEVEKNFTVRFGLSGMGVSPAGLEKDKTGHHHLLINLEEMPDLSKPLPANDNLKHFGGGQTEVELTLEPGTHTLQLLLGNHLHIPHDKPVMSEKITITVKE
ncbi:MAG: ATPases of the AAA+ class [uncultured Thiotrichaceae bacterium]|uniref:ATPases of the AAA+ class n=1 Tax=uncultured Thiotrichaceae bacterium TaxID=298394 RepID=A0A6S6S9B7_9GAMM|nr:MAG: ATPases of the AAA+ class [uncultured Thiotrichaceae bacterium]